MLGSGRVPLCSGSNCSNLETEVVSAAKSDCSLLLGDNPAHGTLPKDLASVLYSYNVVPYVIHSNIYQRKRLLPVCCSYEQ